MNGQIFCHLGGEQLKSLRGCLFDAENNKPVAAIYCPQPDS